MRSEDEVRAEIERLCERRKKDRTFAMQTFPRGQIAALEWALTNERPFPIAKLDDEQNKPKETRE